MAGLTIRQAGDGDREALDALFASTVMGSRIRIGIERGPDYFAGARVQADEPCVWAAFEECGRAVGLFSAGSRRVRVGGVIVSQRYLSDLRIHPDWQGASLLGRGFRFLRREVFRSGEWAQTLVLEDNARALKTLTSGRCGLPEYRPAGRYLSWLLPPQRIVGNSGLEIRSAKSADIGVMQALLDKSSMRRDFSQVVELRDLGKAGWRDLVVSDFVLAERSGTVVGMMGLWDQGRFQRMRIQGYSKGMAALRPCWNAWSRFHGGVGLPAAGNLVPLRKATAIACENDDPEILRALVARCLAGGDRRMLLLGFSERDPLAEGLRGFKGRRDGGRHFLVGWDGNSPEWKEPFAFDVARI